jgi:hypothetical protein
MIIYRSLSIDNISEPSLLVVVDDLDEAPDVKALSYVWGTPNDPVDVPCGNKVGFVTSNLGAALRQLHHADKSRTVWIDALCLYFDRYQGKYRRNLRFRPLFSE